MWSCWCLCMLMVEDGWCLHFSAWHLKGKDLWALWVATWCQVWMRVTLQKSHSSSTGQSCHVCLEQIWSIYHLQSLIHEHDVSILIRLCLPEYALPQCPHFGSWGKFWCRASLRSKRALSFPGSRLLQEVLRRQRHLRHWVLALAIALMALMALVACIRQLNHFAFVGTCWHDWVLISQASFREANKEALQLQLLPNWKHRSYEQAPNLTKRIHRVKGKIGKMNCLEMFRVLSRGTL